MVEEMGEEVISGGFTDHHCHLLPSIDDGPTTIDESVEIARTLKNLGFKKIYCTPHLITGVYDTTNDHVTDAVAILQKILVTEDINIELSPGMEYRLDEHLPECLSDPLTLSDNMILCEPPPQINPEFLIDCVYQINRRGFRPLIAHPERIALISRNDRLMKKLSEMDCLFQGNISSFAGSYGKAVKERAENLLQNDLYYCIASDAHSPDRLEDGLAKGLKNVRNSLAHSYHTLLS